jgi:hypothetical protein
MWPFNPALHAHLRAFNYQWVRVVDNNSGLLDSSYDEYEGSDGEYVFYTEKGRAERITPVVINHW